MSGQDNPSRLPKLSPNSSKKGPMKATVPMSSFVKEGSTLRSESNCTVSPTSYYRTGSSHYAGQRSPGSSAYKGKSKLTSFHGMRRTASLDTIYLQGQWPRDSLSGLLGKSQLHKETQTEVAGRQIIGCISDIEDRMDRCSAGGDTNGRQTSSDDSSNSPQTTTLRRLQRISNRNSDEGLNEEIQEIVLRTNAETEGDRLLLETPDGHRGPLASILDGTRSRSVNTQTPLDFGSSRPSSAGSQGSSPEHGRLSSSPHLNKFVARAPPDGCEKVLSKTVDNKTCYSTDHVLQRPRTFRLKPSAGSAFELLQPSTSESDDQDPPPVPPEEED